MKTLILSISTADGPDGVTAAAVCGESGAFAVFTESASSSFADFSTASSAFPDSLTTNENKYYIKPSAKPSVKSCL